MVQEPVINYEDLINITEQNLTVGHFGYRYPTLLPETDDYISANRVYVIRKINGTQQKASMPCVKNELVLFSIFARANVSLSLLYPCPSAGIIRDVPCEMRFG